MPETLKFSVPSQCDKMCAKAFLKQYCGLSSRMITRLVREKDGILMNGKILRTIDFVESGADVIIKLPSEQGSLITPIKGDLDIAYEDAHLLIVSKPPLMPVHPVKQHQTDTLANRVAYYAQAKNESYVFRAINRLDRDTSGLVLITKDRYCANKLKNAVEKTYYALCHGKLDGSGTIDAPIGLSEDSKMVRHILPDGSPAVTHYEVIYSSEELSFVKLRLETGRTHQIRCHMTSIGHPLLGDDLYGGLRDKITRQALHCGEMNFVHPVTGQRTAVKSEIPNDMKTVLQSIKNED